ncbi:unnamed protein product [Adineta steineri]|uniref:NAD(+)--protein-arginine ADP-ribosyltransferase n=1 Tax=Adineta steineri TaxID=433720 RepID=A0A819Y7E2_9BILA|nr:unnamed protein product [Adineta steineri]CAF4151884.1 unnamed protein product [Adineta steineri]
MKAQELTAENLRSTYLKVPLLNLTEAIKKTTSSGKYLSSCPTGVTSPGTLPFGLTPDEKAAITMYTSSCDVYPELNAALRTEKINEIRPWFSYLKLFDTAISKIPPVKRDYCRGIRVPPNGSYTVGTVITWWGVSSVSTQPSTCKSFSTPTGGGCCGSFYRIKSISASSIAAYSKYPSEAESILLPGTKVKIIDIQLDSKADLYVIDVEAISSDSTGGNVTVKSTTTKSTTTTTTKSTTTTTTKSTTTTTTKSTTTTTTRRTTTTTTRRTTTTTTRSTTTTTTTTTRSTSTTISTTKLTSKPTTKSPLTLMSTPPLDLAPILPLSRATSNER